MRRFNSLFEILKFPLKVLFVAYIIMGIGMVMQNENFAIFYTIKNPIIIMISELMVRIGAFVVVNFPLIVIVKLVSRKTNSSVPIIMGLLGYAVYLSATMIYADPTLPASAFSNILNISYSATQLPNVASGIRYPIQTGLIAAFVVGICTRFSYRQSRVKSNRGVLGVIDRDIWAVVVNMIYCGIAGFLIAIAWPYVFSSFQSVIGFIASDITNPLSLFLYGVMDRVLSILNMNNLLRLPFWFGLSGGTWLSIAGETISGDVTVWSTIMAQGAGAPDGFGRLITPYYVLNIFAIPGMLWGMFSLYTNKNDRHRNIIAILAATLLSMLTGIILPLELMLLFLCPLLLGLHLVVTGSLFGILQIMNITLGFKYSSIANPTIAMPGGIFDFAIHLRNPEMQTITMTIISVGLACFVINFIMTRVFFKYLAFDVFQTGQTKILVDNLIESIGGLENIKEINASPFRIAIEVVDTNIVHRDLLLTTKATKVSETKTGFVLVCGKNSIMIRNMVVRRIKNNTR